MESEVADVSIISAVPKLTSRYDMLPTYDDFVNKYREKIKNDDVALQMVFLGCASTYTNDPINIFIKGVSCIGKTFIPMNICPLFPKKDVWILGGLTPKALIHDYGTDVDGDTLEPIDLEPPAKDASPEVKKEYKDRRRRSKILIDLNNKILIFLEPPQLEAFNILRPILSHDNKEIEFKFVDKGPSGMRTKKVIMRGWPATIFCTTDERYMEELATRSITITPNMTKSKFLDANILSARSFAYIMPTKKSQEELWLSEYLAQECKNTKVLIPYAEDLARNFPHEKPRNMRDFKTFMRLIMAHTSLSQYARPVLVEGTKDEGDHREWRNYILATYDDLIRVLSIFASSYETTITGLPQHVLDFFHVTCERLASANGHFTISEAVDFYNSAQSTKKSSKTIRSWLNDLSDIGWITSSSMSEIDPEADKRQIAFKLTDEVKIMPSVTDRILSNLFNKDKFKTWLNGITDSSQDNEYKYRTDLNSLRAETMDVDKLYSIVFPLSEVAKKGEIKTTDDNKPETVINVENRIIVENYNLQINPMDVVEADVRLASSENVPIVVTPPKPGGKEDSEAHDGRKISNDSTLNKGDPMSMDPSARDAKSVEDNCSIARPPSSPKLVRCTCGAGPWNEESNFALEHIAMMVKVNETGHELVEFKFIDTSGSGYGSTTCGVANLRS